MLLFRAYFLLNLEQTLKCIPENWEPEPTCGPSRIQKKTKNGVRDASRILDFPKKTRKSGVLDARGTVKIRGKVRSKESET